MKILTLCLCAFAFVAGAQDRDQRAANRSAQPGGRSARIGSLVKFGTNS